MNPAQTWIVGKMTAWHEGPYGGRCPRTDGPECSQFGIGAVQRYGAVVGALVAASYVATCNCFDDWTPVPTNNPPTVPNPRRWDRTALLLPLLIGLHLREALPKPDPGSCPLLVVLLLFARIGLFGTAPPGRNCLHERRGEGIPTR